MNPHDRLTRSSVAIIERLVERWTPALVTGSLLLVLVATLYPFNFSFQHGISLELITHSFYHPSNSGDLVRNILLFIPFGFGATCLTQRLKLGFIASFLAVAIASTGLSVTVEILQVFIPSRAPTTADIATNSIGGFLGFVCFYLWKLQLFGFAWAIAKRKWLLSLKTLTASFIGYFSLMCLIAIALQNTINLSNWESSFPLLLGNEQTGERPWQGYVSQVDIAARAISEAEVAQSFSEPDRLSFPEGASMASYRLSGKGSYADLRGNLPELSWQGKPSDTENRSGVLLSDSHWLQTATPADAIAQKISETSQFTIAIALATADTRQYGPARILSVSSDLFQRNFTLGQEESNLVFRLRTPVTGENGSHPDFVVQNVFSDTNFHRLIIIYNGATLCFYVDRVQPFSSLDLTPEIALSRYLLCFLDGWSVSLNSLSKEVYKLFYYGIIFIPLGGLLGFILTISRGKIMFVIVTMVGGILFPAAILEGILMSGSGRAASWENLLYSLIIFTATVAVVKGKAASWLASS
jgi:glycopeptide antibiotics resistance protein